MNPQKLNNLREPVSTILLISVYGFFAWSSGQDFFSRWSVSSGLLLAFETFIIFFVALRSMPQRVSMALDDWVVAMGRMYMPMFFRPAAGGDDLLYLQVLQSLGVIVSLAGIFSLNRSFGLVAADRGIKTGGVYKYIRHPLYAGYCISFPAYVLQNQSVNNAVVLLVFVIFTVMSIRAEERFLSRTKEYADYMGGTRWRMFPFIY